MNVLLAWYYLRVGVKKDYSKVVESFQKPFELGNSDSMLYLVNCYY